MEQTNVIEWIAPRGSATIFEKNVGSTPVLQRTAAGYWWVASDDSIAVIKGTHTKMVGHAVVSATIRLDDQYASAGLAFHHPTSDSFQFFSFFQYSNNPAYKVLKKNIQAPGTNYVETAFPMPENVQVGQEYNMVADFRLNDAAFSGNSVYRLILGSQSPESITSWRYCGSQIDVEGHNVGVHASGPATITNFAVTTVGEVSFSVVNCVDKNILVDRISRVLGVPASTLTVQYDANTCAKKRANEAIPVTVTISLGLAAPHATSIAATATASGLSSVAATFGFAGVSVPAITATAVAAAVGTVVTAAAAAGLTALAIGLIVGGSVVGAGAVATGGYVAYTKLAESESSVEEEIVAPEPVVVFEEPAVTFEEPAPQPKKPRGVDIYNFDPNAIQSLTARSPAVSRN